MAIVKEPKFVVSTYLTEKEHENFKAYSNFIGESMVKILRNRMSIIIGTLTPPYKIDIPKISRHVYVGPHRDKCVKVIVNEHEYDRIAVVAKSWSISMSELLYRFIGYICLNDKWGSSRAKDIYEKRGRRRKKDALRNLVSVRLTNDEFIKLTDYANRIGASRPEAMRSLLSILDLDPSEPQPFYE